MSESIRIADRRNEDVALCPRRVERIAHKCAQCNGDAFIRRKDFESLA